MWMCRRGGPRDVSAVAAAAAAAAAKTAVTGAGRKVQKGQAKRLAGDACLLDCSQVSIFVLLFEQCNIETHCFCTWQTHVQQVAVAKRGESRVLEHLALSQKRPKGLTRKVGGVSITANLVDAFKSGTQITALLLKLSFLPLTSLSTRRSITARAHSAGKLPCA